MEKAINDNLSNFEESKAIYNKGYKAFERGRVVFNLRTQCYEILCSGDMFRNSEFRKSILEEFNLRGCRYDFVPMNHYKRIELTGNPALDSMYYENQE